jgi:hypothetical protein
MYGVQKYPLGPPKDLPIKVKLHMEAQGRATPTVEMHFRANPEILEHFYPGHRYPPCQTPPVHSEPAESNCTSPAPVSDNPIPSLNGSPAASTAGEKRKAASDDRNEAGQSKKAKLDREIQSGSMQETAINAATNDTSVDVASVPQASSLKKKRAIDEVDEDKEEVPSRKKVRVEPALPPAAHNSKPDAAIVKQPWPLVEMAAEPKPDLNPLDDRNKPMVPFSGTLSQTLCEEPVTGEMTDEYWRSISAGRGTESAFGGLSGEDEEVLALPGASVTVDEAEDFDLVFGSGTFDFDGCIDSFYG